MVCCLYSIFFLEHMTLKPMLVGMLMQLASWHMPRHHSLCPHLYLDNKKKEGIYKYDILNTVYISFGDAWIHNKI